MSKAILIDSHFLPSLEYFCALLSFDEIILEGWEHFPKQTYRNRSYINTANGVKILTVPLKERHGKILTKDVKVEVGKKWRNSHWRTIESAYRKAPFFERTRTERRARSCQTPPANCRQSHARGYFISAFAGMRSFG